MSAPARADSRLEVADRENLERSWFESIRSRDEKGLEQLFRTYAEQLCRFAYSHVGSADVAQDLVQQLFCWMWDHGHMLETPRSVRAYLYTAVRNRAISYHRSNRRELSLEERSVHDQVLHAQVAPAGLEDVAATELGEALQRAVAELTPRARDVFLLRRDQGLTNGQVAAVLGISPNTVEIHMTRALAALREKLAPWLRDRR